MLRPSSCRLTVIPALVLPATPALTQVSVNKSVTDRTIAPKERAKVLNALAKALRSEYLCPEIGGKMAQDIEARQLKREYDTVMTGNAPAETLTRHVQEISHNKHLPLFLRHN